MKAAVVAGCLLSAGEARGTSNGLPVIGVNLRLLPYEAGASAAPVTEIARLNDARLELARAAGFNFVRVGIPIGPWIDEAAAPARERTLAILQAMLASAADRQMRFDAALFVPAREIVCEGHFDAGYRAGFDAIVAALPDRSDVAIEAINEPPSCSKSAQPGKPWSRFQEELYRAVRSVRRALTFVVAGARWGMVDGLLQLDPAAYSADPAAMFTFHYYEPFLYTHQQVAWLRADHAEKFVDGLNWPVESGNAGRTLERALAALAADRSLPDAVRARTRDGLTGLFAEYGRQGTVDHLLSRFQSVADWALEHGLSGTRILLGEFGVHRRMPAADQIGEPWPTAPSWLAAVRSQAEQRHFGWVVWDLDSGFGVICGNHAGEGELCPGYREALAR